MDLQIFMSFQSSYELIRLICESTIRFIIGRKFGAISHVFSCFSLGSCMCGKVVLVYSTASVSSVGCPVAFSAVFEACRNAKREVRISK